ncbi:MAG: hypothetical protein CK528_10680 [Alcaligenaceae bacterium]|nr:MAG: hypothetical protein CK528_10680 [Alcaligenaceae bacterium]
MQKKWCDNIDWGLVYACPTLNKSNGAIQKVETTLHSELTNQTWLIVKWMSGLLVTLLPSLFAAVFYVARYTH